jgi:hypothetical protein
MDAFIVVIVTAAAAFTRAAYEGSSSMRLPFIFLVETGRHLLLRVGLAAKRLSNCYSR